MTAARTLPYRWLSGPFVAAQCRLTGPHADPESARRGCAGLPIALSWPERRSLLLRWRLSSGLHRRYGEEYRPKLEG